MAQVNLTDMIGQREVQLAAAKLDHKTLSDQYAMAMGAWAVCDGWFAVIREHLLVRERRARLEMIEGRKSE